MYIPAPMSLTDAEAVSLIDSHPFALLISNQQRLVASHLPLVFDSDRRRIIGHMARANGQWRALDGQSVLAVFSGPHAYISPRWYQAKPAVPTWNYSAAHVYGTFNLLDEKEDDGGVEAVLKHTIARFEPELWDDETLMPKDYVGKLSKAIVAFEIVVERIEAKAKLGQHRKMGDQEGVSAALKSSERLDDMALYREMQRMGLGLGTDSQTEQVDQSREK
ncbi:FMN-binding negative transcriptional regulator [Shewanella amazonensis]|uniref:Negative transcriptional regulator n=1 Tax=Shewanella amazonensis (strain ATCC BAA-1098 / SB2B) TaxID=326297 RepID=A1S658_SHEAM|nr:FMN-binding negative transcriptional regulator [Shewanella amazonensis]ABL99864.1 negative transcriptional regulator [Shewanella amazonensis SB2B]